MTLTFLQLLGLVVSLVVLGASLLLLVLCYVASKCSKERTPGISNLCMVLMVLSMVTSVGVLMA